ncbi:MAG: hypothetical protein ACREUG_01175 [Steroidobacteraceae bacterium]
MPDHRSPSQPDRAKVYVLVSDLERAESREGLRQALGEAGYERAVLTGGRFVAVWLGVRGDVVTRLADQVDLLLLERLLVDVIVGRGSVLMHPLGLAPETLQAMNHEFQSCWAAPPSPKRSRVARRPRLRLVVNNPDDPKRCEPADVVGRPSKDPR